MKKNLKDKKSLNIAMLGHKRIPSREGGIEIVVEGACDDVKQVQKYKDEAADYICEKYNWDDVVERTLELYRD